jgi:tetratricopeptide (TPR) repeat protein
MVDAATADALVEIALEAQARTRRQDLGAHAEVEARYPEMLDALDWFLDAGRPEAAYRLATALVPFWMSSKRIDDGDAWFERALASTPREDPSRAEALYEHGYLVFWAGRYDLAGQRFTASLAMAEDSGDASVQALALAGLARIALGSDLDDAVRLLRRAVDVTEGMRDSERGRSSALHVLGVALQMSGDFEGAREVMSARLEGGRATGDQFVVWVESANLSMVERRLGNLDRAEELALQALAIDAVRGDEMSIAWTVNSVAAVAAAKADLERAAVLVGLASALLERAGGEWPPDEREQYDETAATLTAGLPTDVLAAACARGGSMSVEAGVAFALGAPDNGGSR